MEVLFTAFMSGTVAPFIIGIFTRKNWPKAANQAIAFAVSTLGGVLLLMLQGQLDMTAFSGMQLMGTISIIMTVSDKFYRMFKGTVHDIEEAVTIKTRKSSVEKVADKVLEADGITRSVAEFLSREDEVEDVQKRAVMEQEGENADY